MMQTLHEQLAEKIEGLEDRIDAIELRFVDITSGKEHIKHVRSLSTDEIGRLVDDGRAVLTKEMRG